MSISSELIALMERLDRETRPWLAILGKAQFMPSAWVPDSQMYVLDLSASGMGEGYRVVGSPRAVDLLCALGTTHGLARGELAACIVWHQLDKFKSKREARVDYKTRASWCGIRTDIA